MNNVCTKCNSVDNNFPRVFIGDNFVCRTCWEGALDEKYDCVEKNKTNFIEKNEEKFWSYMFMACGVMGVVVRRYGNAMDLGNALHVLPDSMNSIIVY